MEQSQERITTTMVGTDRPAVLLPIPRSWNDTTVEYRLGSCVHEVIAATAGRTPHAVALVFDGGDEGRRELTYRELDRWASRLAGELKGHGVGPDVLVGVHLERSPELVVTLLAVLKAGGAYLALDPLLPPARLSFMLSDSAARITVSASSGVGLGELPHGLTLLAPGEPADEDSAASETRNAPPVTAPASALSDRALAYVLYTSGSTGRPKGVLTEHRSIMNRLLWMQDAFPIGARDAVLQKTPLGFDVSVWEFFWPLMRGARLVLARPGGHMDPDYLADLIHTEGVTVVHFVPSMLQLFLEQSRLRERTARVRHVMASGEALPYSLCRRFYQHMPEGASLHNLYGPTEAAVDVSSWTVPRDGWNDQVVPIGRPVSNTRLYVLDPDGWHVGVGAVGELHIGGVQVARGYLNRPQLTRERFVPDPFAPGPGNLLFRTGDRARWRKDGTLEYLGRMDRQCKVRGQRIEPGEVEAALLSVEGVREAAVAVEGADPTEARLVAYVVADKESTKAAPGELRRALRKILPEGWIPSLFVALDTMPLNASGKLDHQALPSAARGTRPSHVAAYRAPRDGLESFLADLWAKVLELDRVGIDDPFFELGGTSLQAARVVNAIREELGSFIYVVTLFEAATVAAYAELLRREYAPSVDAHPGWDAGIVVPRAAGVDAGKSPGSLNRARIEPRKHMSKTVNEAMVKQFESCVPRHLDVPEAEQADRNATAIFILAPPRSGTTLLQLMLGGHPSLFAASELHLLNFRDLGQRHEALARRHGAWLDGLIRVVMELTDCEAEPAWRLHNKLADEALPTRAAYGMLQQWTNRRILVDKTPAYALDPEALQKAERDFREPLYIHLVRHPYATVRSFVDQHIHQVLYLKDHGYSPRELGELIWVVSHRNIHRFLNTIPETRKVRLRFEDMVRHTRASMHLLCERLGVSFHPALLAPYEGLGRKMSNGVHPESTPMGDPGAFRRSSIDARMAEGWRGVLKDDFLGPPTWALADTLGYGPRPLAKEIRMAARRTAEEARANDF